MRDTYLTYPYLHIPYNFADKHLRKTIKNVMVRNSEDKVWMLGYWNGDSSAQLCSGWTSLRRDLGLTEGDVCVFELLKGKDTEMRVSVFREIDNVLTRI
ncbi:B3 domain-containing protein At5g18000-like [Papaver somniferum]|uniref:B3 domain-containing protein At5g18000-like n=1 Tax=Papaver somniferum TaxID=3469 RepID=UPI000E702EF7|nr:B3 domain-containing protein At5g18000-like [Papaver somniferum]